jgi:diguanylate cyclase (GGDEF)-like protein
MASDGIERSRGMAAELLDAYWVAKPQPFSRRGLIVEAVAAAAFLLTSLVVALAVGGEARISGWETAALVLAYAAASQVRFAIGSSFVVPTQLLLMPLLLLAPLGLVPFLVAAGLLLGNAHGVVCDRLPRDRLVSCVADGWHALGPVAVLALAGPADPGLDQLGWYAIAFVAQAVVEAVTLSLREWLDRGIPPLRHVLSVGEGQIVDALLAPVGLLAAFAGTAEPTWSLLVVPLLALLAIVDHERRQRIRLSQTRLAALRKERERRQASLGRIGEAIATKLDSAKLLNLAARTAIDAIGADEARVIDGPDVLAVAGSAEDGTELLEAAVADARRAGTVRAVSHDDLAAVASPLPGYGDEAVLTCVRRGEPFSSDESAQLLSLAAQVAAALQMAGLHERLREQAQTDGLTGLANRRHFQDRLSAEANRSRRHGTALGLVLLDVDHFKHVNDTYGHHAGDLVLQHVASVVEDSCRPYDLAARYGGEEIAILAPQTDAVSAATLAERMRRAIAESTVSVGSGVTVTVTVSAGVAALEPEDVDATTPDELLRRVDAALYGAKRAGRDRVELAPA